MTGYSGSRRGDDTQDSKMAKRFCQGFFMAL
jgi:hypothetical protein